MRQRSHLPAVIQHTLKRVPNKTHAAEMLGIILKTLHNKLTEYREKDKNRGLDI